MSSYEIVILLLVQIYKWSFQHVDVFTCFAFKMVRHLVNLFSVDMLLESICSSRFWRSIWHFLNNIFSGPAAVILQFTYIIPNMASSQKLSAGNPSADNRPGLKTLGLRVIFIFIRFVKKSQTWITKAAKSQFPVFLHNLIHPLSSKMMFWKPSLKSVRLLNY